MPASPFASIEAAPPDPILGLTEAFNADTNPKKVNLGVGVYQDETGKVPVLNVVREAEELLRSTEATKSYLPIDGAPAYNAAVKDLLFGTAAATATRDRTVVAQAPGGTGALKLGADFLHRFLPNASVYISSPSWENHRALFEAAGFHVGAYPYYDPASHGLNFAAMLAALEAIPAGNIVLLHACCHNPTGVDLSREQWNTVLEIVARKNLLPFLDFAYQGFGQGIEEDAYAVRTFANAGIPAIVSSSFSKSFSLYRERVGAISILSQDGSEAKRCLSQLKRVIRTNYSNPPSHGAQIVATVLQSSALRVRWEGELGEMRNRIHEMRTLFVESLKAKGVPGDFSFIARQQGMFSFSGLSLDQVRRLRSEFSLYIVDSGRICVAAMNRGNMDYICSAIAKVLS